MVRLREAVSDVVDDIRFAWRQQAKSPGFAAIAILTLALSIGANTAIFSVVHRLLLDPLPFPNGNRIVMPMQGTELPFRSAIGPDVVNVWRSRTHTVSTIAAATEATFAVRTDGTVDTIPSATITANFLPTLGVHPLLGRGFAADDEHEDQPAVAMISYSLWQRSYGGRADVVGKTVPLAGRPLTIVGVTPRGLAIPLWRAPPPDVWVPEPLAQAVDGANGVMEPGPRVFALLRDGSSAASASQELQAIVASLPDSAVRLAPASVMRAQDFLSSRERRAVEVLFAAVGALLLIACANLANLLLARAWARQREFAVRGALGAGRARLARQVLTESVLLALMGALLGVGVAWLALRVIVAMRPARLEHLADVRLDPSVLLWCLGVSVVTGILFGSAPALFAGTQQAGDVLRRETRGGSQGRTSSRVRSGLIVVEIAASLVLLVGSGLLVRSFAALENMPLGFEPRGLVYTDVVLGTWRYREGRVALRDAVVERVRTLPGVTGVAIGVMPGKGYRTFGGLEAETGPHGRTVLVPTQGIVFMSPDYFRVAHIALLEGRLPDSTGWTPSTNGPLGFSPEVVVNREFARRVWPGGHALGARVREMPNAARGEPAQTWSTIVGVVDDTRMPEVRGDVAALQLYSLIPPRLGDVPFIVRARTSGDVAAPRIKQAIASVNPSFFVRQMLSGDTYLRDGLAPTRFAMALISAFAVLALVLSAVGLYGVVAYGVNQRTREIGVRVALGAEPKRIVGMVLGGGLRLAVTGVVIGAATAVAMVRVIESMLYDVRPVDPLTFGAVSLLVILVALVACYVPARRALRIEPAEAIRAD